MDSVVNNLISSWDSVLNETEKKRNSFFNLSNKSTDQHQQVSELQPEAPMSSNQSVSSQQQIPAQTSEPSASSSLFNSSQLTDKLVERIISMALPPSSESQFTQGVITERLEMQKTRPSLSVPIMSRNFILLNSRLSIPFELIDEIIKVISWQNPNYTLSVLIIATNVVLNPVLLAISPFLYILFGIMSPAYFKHHPPEKSFLGGANPIPSRGFPLVEVSTPKPVPQLSREFVLNLTDLQNHMLLYVVVFDFFNWIVIEFCYFKDEAVSSFIFLALLGSTVGLSLFLPLAIKTLPLLKLIQSSTVIATWSLLILLHPFMRDQLLIYFYSEETRLKLLTLTNKMESRIKHELQFVEEQELREVEIFEIQHLDPVTRNWSFVCYSPDFYTVNSTSRKQNLAISGSPSLAQIAPPFDWNFVPNIQPTSQTSNWKLDLNPKAWVQANHVSGVIEIDEDEKWCYDKAADGSSAKIRRRRWCREVIRSFQVDEIVAASKKQESLGETKIKEKKYTVNETGFHKINNDNENDEGIIRRKNNYLLDNQYNHHLRQKSGSKW